MAAAGSASAARARALLLLLALVSSAATPPAHVLMVVVDDLGFSDLGYKRDLYPTIAVGPSFATPTLDALALVGVRLESYYVHALCSPSRTAFLSGRYAYTTGMNAEVIQNGHPDSLATNIRTVADLLKLKGWATSAYGKQDYGMTTWGCTPTCRGFDHFSGFYNADEDYFSHGVGGALDLRRDFEADRNETGVFSSDLFGDRAAAWVAATLGGAGAAANNSFAYLAFQAIHAPQQAPAAYLAGHCTDAFPANQPIRRIACAQMASVDANVAKVIAAYKAAGVWDETLVIFTADNGGNVDTGGSNAPLRGMKATMFEGGMRAAAFVSGAGLEPSVRGSVSHELYSLVDWLPTIAGSIAGVDLAEAMVPKHPAFQPAPPPLDGMDVWQSLSSGGASPRTEALLYLSPSGCFSGVDVSCAVPGQGAYRMGNYKLIHGHISQYMGTTNVSGQFCGPRDGDAQPNTSPINVTVATAPPFCPTGWVALDESVRAPPEHAGPGGACATTPCRLPGSSPLLAGGTFLYDVVNDMTEEHDLAAEQPALVAQILARLQAINATNVPQSNSPIDPASDPGKFGGVWTPWRGDPRPEVCDCLLYTSPSPRD
jgi:arylsulfatase B